MKKTGEKSCESEIIRQWEEASVWPEGYPLGNGRIGAMVLGGVKRERAALNHDLLWRRFWKYQPRKTAGMLEKISALCGENRWDEAEDLLLQKIPSTGRAIYVNPFVPAGDLYVDFFHGGEAVSDYERILDLGEAAAKTDYRCGGVRYTRESFCCYEKNLFVMHLSADRAGVLSGEVSLSRLPDPECRVTGHAGIDFAVMEGEFEEGVRFAAAVRVLQRGGRLTAGRRDYAQPDRVPDKDFGLRYRFRQQEQPEPPPGVSVCFDSADEVTLLVAVVIDAETELGSDAAEECLRRLNEVEEEYSGLRARHVADHRTLYDRTVLRFSGRENAASVPDLIEETVSSGALPAELTEKIFNMSRYLAIASGRPRPEGEPCKAPINLQGLWNEDRRPAWDCDYHLDLNLEMCYWPLDGLGLGELMLPLMSWAERMLPDGRAAARDLYGCGGAVLCGVCDNKNIGNIDNVCFGYTAAGAWIASILWQHWEYAGSKEFLKDRLYPYMLEIAAFYADFLKKDGQGRLVPPVSTSPEMPIAGRARSGFLSSASTMDLELIRSLFTHLVLAGEIVGENPQKSKQWDRILHELPMPVIDGEDCLAEWLLPHEPGDPGHRHRSHLVGLCPGDRITPETAPEYADAAYRALQKRYRCGGGMSQSLSYAWDAQLLARLYRGEEAAAQLASLVSVHALGNLLFACNDWRGDRGGLAWFPDVKLFQIEASLAAGAAVLEMVFQDRGGLLRFLPALPASLAGGEARGLRARGGFEADLRWRDGRLYGAEIRSAGGGECRVLHRPEFEGMRIVCGETETVFTVREGVLVFDTLAGKSYRFLFKYKNML